MYPSALEKQGPMTIDPPHTEQDRSYELSVALLESAAALFSAGGLKETLQRTVDLALQTIDGCDFAGIFILDDDAVTTPAHTDPIVLEIDRLQYHLGEGPSLDAIAHGTTFCAEYLADDRRWPHFGPQASSAGINGALALVLSANGTRGALNLYARYRDAFGVIDRGKALVLAILAGIAISSAEAHDDEEHRTVNLQAALVSREVIGQAQGILMERERITSDQAFDILRRASQRLNIKLRDVAQDLVDSGESPQLD
jgi:hypothetical protein